MHQQPDEFSIACGISIAAFVLLFVVFAFCRGIFVSSAKAHAALTTGGWSEIRIVRKIWCWPITAFSGLSHGDSVIFVASARNPAGAYVDDVRVSTSLFGKSTIKV